MSISKLDKNVYLVEGENRGRYPFSNSILIKDSCLLDSGAGKGLRGLKVETIVNSHWHEDHIAKNCIADKVFAHELDAEAVENFEEFKDRYRLGELVKIFVNFEFCKVHEVFRDGDVLEFKSRVEVIHTPGHSAGHCCFLIDDRILYLADIDLSSFGPWYGCWDCDVDDFINSIKRIRRVIEEGVEIAVPGHGEVVRGNEEILRRLDIYLQTFFNREERIKEFVLSGEDPVGKGIFYKRLPEPKEVYEHFERIMIEKHMQRLGLKLDL